LECFGFHNVCVLKKGFLKEVGECLNVAADWREMAEWLFIADERRAVAQRSGLLGLW